MTHLSDTKARAFSHLVEQHAENAAFLWLLRARAVNQCQHTPESLAQLEQRINAHLRGLYLTPELAWECALASAQSFQGPGELFVLAMLALESSDKAQMETVLALSESDPECQSAVTSAFGWQASAKVYPLLRAWIDSDLAYPRYLALATSSIRRLDPKGYLNRALTQDDTHSPEVLARAARLAGELGRQDSLNALRPLFAHDEPAVVFWAHWSAHLLGEQHIEGLMPFVTEPGPLQERAINLAARALPPEQVWSFINALINSQQDHQAIIALGALGDPRSAGWLLTRMEEPALNPIAAESFGLITGLTAPLEAVSPSPDSDNPDEPGDDAPIEGYEDLLPADNDQLLNQWQQARDQFRAGERYLLGQPWDQAPLSTLMAQGHQKQRQGAALTLALKAPTAPLSNTSALQEVNRA